MNIWAAVGTGCNAGMRWRMARGEEPGTSRQVKGWLLSVENGLRAKPRSRQLAVFSHVRSFPFVYLSLLCKVGGIILNRMFLTGWRIPGTGEPCGLPPMGSHRVGHD